MSAKLTAFLISCALFVASPHANAQGDDTLRQAQALIAQKKPDQALLLLNPLEADLAGDVRFDYLLAIATLDAGDPGKAVLVFERVLAVDPHFHGARIDLGRAFMQTGRYADARAQFTAALDNNPPAAARSVIDQYLATIHAHDRRLKFSYSLDARTRAGYDSNVNSGTALAEFLGFAISDTSREQDSDFFEVGVAGAVNYTVLPNLVLSARLGYSRRANSQASFANSEIGSFGITASQATATQRRTLSVRAFELHVDGQQNNRAATVTGDWSYNLTGNWWLGGVARLGLVRYADALAVKDVNQTAIGVTTRYLLGGAQQGYVAANLMLGKDDPQVSSSRYARDFTSLGATLGWRFTAALSGQLAASFEDSRYDATFFEQQFDEPRNDFVYRGRGSLNWNFAKHWRLNHSLSYTLNETDVEIFEYERFELGLGVNYVWF